jgi:ribosomal protein S18 acetylase RimI-like enzyme
MTDDFRVTPATADDARTVAQIFIAARSGMQYLPPPAPTEATMTSVFARRIGQGGVILAWHDGQAVGFGELADGYVNHLYVDPAFQGRGIGTRLLDTLKAMSAHELRLWVFDENAGAIRWYEREGFVLEERRDAQQADNMEGLPDRRYVWRPRPGPSSR